VSERGDFRVLTNNGRVLSRHPGLSSCVLLFSSPLEVYEGALRLLCEGYELLVHPRYGNVRLSKAPFRTLVLARGGRSPSPASFELLFSCLDELKEGGMCSPPLDLASDFMDLDLGLVGDLLEDLEGKGGVAVGRGEQGQLRG